MIEIEKAAKAFWKERHTGIDYREADSIPGTIAINDIIAFAAFCLDKSGDFPMKELQRRHDIIMSEPDGIVRETMISNLLIDL